MHRIVLFLSVVVLTACSIFDKEEVAPGFVRITDVNVNTILLNEGEGTYNITDVQVFANEQFVGAFELPATVPILEKGPVRLSVNAGIKNNGISSNRIIYPFYEPLLLNVNLEPGLITPLNQTETATFEYFPSGLIFNIEGFESIGNAILPTAASTATFTTTNDPAEVRSGTGAGKIVLAEGSSYFFATTTWQLPVLPRGRTMYLEIDFKGTAPLEVGVFTTNPITAKTFAIGLLPKDEYTKVYIEVTDEVSQQISMSGIKFYFEAVLQPGQIEATIFIDNFKFIFPEI